MRLRSATAVVLVLLVGTKALRADILHLKDGRKIEGKILEEEGGNYVVKLKGGTMRIAKKEVSRVEARKLPEEEFRNPPLMEALLPVTVLVHPPEMEAKSPRTVFSRPAISPP